MMIDSRIFMKRMQDIEVKVALCKNNFHWKILAEKFQSLTEEIDIFYTDSDQPDELLAEIERVRELLVTKKAELPPEDLIV